MENYVDWKSTEIFEDGEENYFKEIIWRNHKVKVFVFWDNESKFTKKIIISKTNNLLENEIDYYLEKTKDTIIECLMNNSEPSEDMPKIILKHIEFYGIENVKKKLLKIIGIVAKFSLHHEMLTHKIFWNLSKNHFHGKVALRIGFIQYSRL